MRKLAAAMRLSGLFRSDSRFSCFCAALVVALMVVASAGTGWAQGAAPVQALAVADYGKLPLSFEANQGQSDAAVRFLSRGEGYSLFLTDSAAVLSLSKSREGRDGKKNDVVRMELVGAAKGAQVSGAEKLPGIANYFIGKDANKWHTNIPTYERVKYTGVYPGVDLVYYGNQRQLEYDFVVAPHADARAVRLQFTGAQQLKIDAHGNLAVEAKNGAVVFHKPVVYQVIDGTKEVVDGRFALMAKNEVGFALGKYDAGRELVIDPTLIYSTYLGGTKQDAALAVTADASGNAYVTGYTLSTTFPVTSAAFQKTESFITNSSTSAIFVTKLNAAGSGLVYSTYLSGTETHCTAGPNDNSPVLDGDFGAAIAVDRREMLTLRAGLARTTSR
jgi:hypothetical protein